MVVVFTLVLWPCSADKPPAGPVPAEAPARKKAPASARHSVKKPRSKTVARKETPAGQPVAADPAAEQAGAGREQPGSVFTWDPSQLAKCPPLQQSIIDSGTAPSTTSCNGLPSDSAIGAPCGADHAIALVEAAASRKHEATPQRQQCVADIQVDARVHSDVAAPVYSPNSKPQGPVEPKTPSRQSVTANFSDGHPRDQGKAALQPTARKSPARRQPSVNIMVVADRREPSAGAAPHTEERPPAAATPVRPTAASKLVSPSRAKPGADGSARSPSKRVQTARKLGRSLNPSAVPFQPTPPASWETALQPSPAAATKPAVPDGPAPLLPTSSQWFTWSTPAASAARTTAHSVAGGWSPQFAPSPSAPLELPPVFDYSRGDAGAGGAWDAEHAAAPSAAWPADSPSVLLGLLPVQASSAVHATSRNTTSLPAYTHTLLESALLRATSDQSHWASSYPMVQLNSSWSEPPSPGPDSASPSLRDRLSSTSGCFSSGSTEPPSPLSGGCVPFAPALPDHGPALAPRMDLRFLGHAAALPGGHYGEAESDAMAEVHLYGPGRLSSPSPAAAFKDDPVVAPPARFPTRHGLVFGPR